MSKIAKIVRGLEIDSRMSCGRNSRNKLKLLKIQTVFIYPLELSFAENTTKGLNSK